MIRSRHKLAARRAYARRTPVLHRCPRAPAKRSSRPGERPTVRHAYVLQVARSQALLLRRGAPVYTTRGARLQPLPQPSQE